MKYYRLTDGLNRVGKLISEKENPYNHIDDQDKDWYLSLYKYTEEQKRNAEEIIEVEKSGKKYKRHRGVSGIDSVTTNKLVFDVDSTDLEKARKDAVEIVERLKEKGFNEKEITISFSGGKGFSIVLEHDKELTPSQHEFLAKNIADGLETFDTSVYNASRIFRLDFTKHNKTGLYKTPISYSQLKKAYIDTIKKMASNKKEPKLIKKIVSIPEDLIKVETVSNETRKETTEVNYAIDFSKKPYYLNDIKYALHKGFIPPGKGNQGMMILAATYRHVGFDKIDAYHMLKGVNEKRAEIYNIEMRTNDEIWKEVVETVYAPSWKGGVYSKDENDLLQETATRFGISDKSAIVGIEQIGNKFIKFASNINANVIRTGIKSLDDSILITTGMMVGTLAAPSAGKTSFAISFVENLSSRGQTVLFESLDMYDNLLYQRLIQKASGVDVQERLRKMIKDDPTYDPSYKIDKDQEIIDATKLVKKKYENVEFNSSRGANIESIEEDIRVTKAKHGDNLKLVVVDYLEKVRGPYSDATANSGYVASRLSDLASMYDVAILLLLQPQKSAGDPSEELLSMRKVKGASVIEQDCRVILTLWRPGFSPKDSSNDKYASIAVVKNNMGEVKQLDFGWNGMKGQLNELTQAERDYLESLREEIKNQKEESKKSGWDI